MTLLGAPPNARTTDPQTYAFYLETVQFARQIIVEASAIRALALGRADWTILGDASDP